MFCMDWFCWARACPGSGDDVAMGPWNSAVTSVAVTSCVLLWRHVCCYDVTSVAMTSRVLLCCEKSNHDTWGKVYFQELFLFFLLVRLRKISRWKCSIKFLDKKSTLVPGSTIKTKTNNEGTLNRTLSALNPNIAHGLK